MTTPQKLEVYTSSKNAGLLENKAMKDKIKAFEQFKAQQEKKQSDTETEAPLTGTLSKKDMGKQLMEYFMTRLVEDMIPSDEEPAEVPEPEPSKEEIEKQRHKQYKNLYKIYSNAKMFTGSDIKPEDIMCMNKCEYDILTQYRLSINQHAHDVAQKTLKKKFFSR